MSTPDSRSGGTLPLGTVTFLLTDVEGSTQRWEADPKAMADAQAQMDAIIDDAVARHGGARPIEQGEGDSAVAAFARASDAVAAALELQQKTIEHPWPVEPPLRLRIALHTGEAEVTSDLTYFGNAINRCARLRDAAHGGQTVLSRATNDLVLDHLPGGASLEASARTGSRTCLGRSMSISFAILISQTNCRRCARSTHSPTTFPSS